MGSGWQFCFAGDGNVDLLLCRQESRPTRSFSRPARPPTAEASRVPLRSARTTTRRVGTRRSSRNANGLSTREAAISASVSSRNGCSRTRSGWSHLSHDANRGATLMVVAFGAGVPAHRHKGTRTTACSLRCGRSRGADARSPAAQASPRMRQLGHQPAAGARVGSAINRPAPKSRSTIRSVVYGCTSSRPASVARLTGPRLDKITKSGSAARR